MPERRFVDRVVVITGGAGGIGAALGRAFIEEGARVALLDLDRAKLDEAVSALPVDRGAGRAMAVEVDVTDESRCGAAIAAVCGAWGGVDVLVNNAGISHRSLFSETESSVLRKVMDVNFFGAVYCTAAALPSLTERGGQLVVISSVAGFAPLVGRTGYCASKHALHGFFDSLRSELDGTVDVTMVCPSFIATKIDQNALSGHGTQLGRAPRAVSGSVMQPAEVASAIVDAAAHRKRLLTPSTLSRNAWWISRIAPRLYERLMLRSQADEFPRT